MTVGEDVGNALYKRIRANLHLAVRSCREARLLLITRHVYHLPIEVALWWVSHMFRGYTFKLAFFILERVKCHQEFMTIQFPTHFQFPT